MSDVEMVNCDDCKRKIKENGDEDFHFEIPKGLFPEPFNESKGVCITCWLQKGYKTKYNEYIKMTKPFTLSSASTSDLWTEVYYRAIKDKAISLGKNISDEQAKSLAIFANESSDNGEDWINRNEDLINRINEDVYSI